MMFSRLFFVPNEETLMSQYVFRSLIALFVLLVTIVAPAQGATDTEIESARLKGMQFLVDAQLEDGSWEYEGHEVGITSLCAVALIENGTEITDPVVQNAEKYVKGNYIETVSTYDIALAILFLSRMGDNDNRGAIRDLAARLVAGQNTDGGWGYSCPKVRAAYLSGGGDRPDPPKGPGDNSCTQFAVLGLWVSSRWNVDIDETMVRVAQRFAWSQNEDGGWPYKPETEPPKADTANPNDPNVDPMPEKKEDEPKGPRKNYAASKNTMTFAGLFCVTVARATQIRAMNEGKSTTSRRPSRKVGDEEADDYEVVDPGANAKTILEDPIFQKGLVMASKYAPQVSNGGVRDFLWSVERMGVILGEEEFGTTNWFDVGAAALLKLQTEEGSWDHPTWGGNSDTAFAILFLRKANLGSDITRLLEGEPDEPVQIITQDDEPRFFNLEDAVGKSKPGDIIRLEGNNTFRMPHLDIKHDLTIQAGFGYTPVIQYDLGYDKSGIRSAPKNDIEARHMIRSQSGTLTLEGLHLQMDGPRTIKNVPWNAVVVEGGNVRILNCTISESTREGMAAVVLRGAGTVEMRNTQVIGGRAAFEVTTGGDQKITVANSVLFSDGILKVAEGAQPGDGLHVEMERVAAQAREVFNFPRSKTAIELD